MHENRISLFSNSTILVGKKIGGFSPLFPWNTWYAMNPESNRWRHRLGAPIETVIALSLVVYRQLSLPESSQSTIFERAGSRALRQACDRLLREKRPHP